MILGIGTDVVSIPRFARALERAPRMRQRIFGPLEQNMPLSSLAARFAAREALMKAWEPARGFRMVDMQVTRGGKPEFAFSGKALQTFRKQPTMKVHLTLSHERDITVAFVVVESYE